MANIAIANLTLDWRPTYQLRLNGLYQLQRVGRRTDGSTVNIQRSPRLKIEYQLSRPIFLRLVGEYTTERQDALRDDTRTGAPILIFGSDANAYVRRTAFGRRSFRGDFLFSYQPNPPVRSSSPATAARSAIQVRSGGPASRTEDGFFFKLSYLFQM